MCEAYCQDQLSGGSVILSKFDFMVKKMDMCGWSDKDFPKGTFDLKEPELNVPIRDKISFVGVAHLTRGGRSCSWALCRG